MKTKITVLLIAALSILTLKANAGNGGRIEYARFPVKMLSGVKERDYAIYLPENYDANSSAKYPVLYLLHGGSGSYKDWPTVGRMKEIADSLISGGMIRPLVIVSPDGRYRDNTMWLDMDGWTPEEHFFDELMPYMESRYRIRNDKEGRAIAGLSLGGGAALGYALDHPDKFAASCGMSAYIVSVPAVVNDGNRWIQDAVNRHDPVEKVRKASDRDIEGWKTVDWMIDCGDHDFTIQANTELDQAMNVRRLPHEFIMRPGAHTWTYWTSSLPLVLNFIDRAFEK